VNVLLYLRQSLAKNGESEADSLSLDGQETAIRARAGACGWTVAEVIRDHDVSGADPDRPGMNRLRARVAAGGIEAVVVFDLKRFARDFVWQELTYRELKARGVKLISLADPNVDHTLMRQVMGSVNEFQREELARYITMANAELAKRGLTHGQAPFGYEKVAIDGQRTKLLMPHPDQAERYRWLVDHFLAGESYQQLAAALNAEGVPARRAANWNGDTVRFLLTNPVYVGDVRYKGGIVARDCHPALIDRETYRRVQQAIRTRGVVKHKPLTVSSWCEGVVRHCCGRRMYLQTVKTANGVCVYFGCRGAYTKFDLCQEERRFVTATKLEAAVRQGLSADLSSLTTLDDALRRAEERAGGQEIAAARTRLQRRRIALQGQRERAEQLYTTGRRPLAWFDERDAELQASLTAIADELAALPHAPYPMKGVGPFTHTNPLDRPPAVFGGKNTLHFGDKFAPYLLLPIIPKSA
jgi:DNA invertase Pin-like site-specific DNA recombinase